VSFDDAESALGLSDSNASTERLAPLLSGALNTEKHAKQSEPLAHQPDDGGSDVIRAGFNHRGKAAHVPFLERVAKSRHALKAIIRSRKEEVVVVENKDVDAAARLQICHFRRNVVNVAQPVPVTRGTLAMQRGNAAE
jgi:hypothetical protein